MLSGTVSSKYVIDKAADVAGGYVDKKENVVNLLKQQEGVASNQVMLRVRFAEVSRNALQELGVNLFTGATGYKNVDRAAPRRSSSRRRTSPTDAHADLNDNLTGASGKFTFSDFLNLFVFSAKYNIGARRQGAADQGPVPEPGRAEPDRDNGKEASFLAGGEYPYPGRAGRQRQQRRHDQFKEFGVRLELHADGARRRPDPPEGQARGQLARLRQRRQLSRLPRAGALDPPHRDRSRAAGRPDVRDRRPDEQHRDVDDVEDSRASATSRFSGYLFKSRAYQKQQTELVVMITPHDRPQGRLAGVSQGLPSIAVPYLGPPEKAHAAAGAVHRFAALPRAGEKPKTTSEAAPSAAPAPVPTRSSRWWRWHSRSRHRALLRRRRTRSR